MIIDPADVTFDILWRDAAGTDHPIASVMHHFDPQPSGFAAVPFAADVQGVAAKAAANDTLVFRFTAQGAQPAPAILYIPNSDGAHTGGHIPSLTLPR